MKNDAEASLAEKIAHLIAAEPGAADLSSMSESIDKINDRLDKLESHRLIHPSPLTPHPSSHPSQDRFAIAEAIIDSLFDSDSKEKACTFETSKPCDHCAMCSSRGF